MFYFCGSGSDFNDDTAWVCLHLVAGPSPVALAVVLISCRSQAVHQHSSATSSAPMVAGINVVLPSGSGSQLKVPQGDLSDVQPVP